MTLGFTIKQHLSLLHDLVFNGEFVASPHRSWRTTPHVTGYYVTADETREVLNLWQLLLVWEMLDLFIWVNRRKLSTAHNYIHEAYFRGQREGAKVYLDVVYWVPTWKEARLLAIDNNQDAVYSIGSRMPFTLKAGSHES